ncbi:zinc finger, CCHC-type containing protein [Tanacetum coccineum]
MPNLEEHLAKDDEKNVFWSINDKVQESLLNLKNTMYHSRHIRYFPILRQDQDHCLALKNTTYPLQRIRQRIRRVRYFGQHSEEARLHPIRLLEGFYDANWISNHNQGKSTSGYVFTLGRVAVSWKSSKQTLNTISTMEAEFVALDKAAEEAGWLRSFLKAKYYGLFLIGITYTRLMCGRIFGNQMAKFSKILINKDMFTTEMNTTMASNFAKLDKFEGVYFKRWQKKMHFLLSSMGVVYGLTTRILEDRGDDATVEQIRKRAKWDNDDYVCRGLILKDFKHTLKHKKDELTLVELGSHLRIEESLKAAVLRLSDPKLKTLGKRGIKCIFVGYAEHSKAFRFYVIEPNDSVSINSIIESMDADFDKNRFSSVPRPSQKSMVKGTEDSGGLVVSEKVTEEVVQQPEPELRKSKRNRTPKDFGPEFQLYPSSH